MSTTLQPPVADKYTAPRKPPEPAVTSTVAPREPRERLLSLDVFRGLTVAGMLLVNNPGTWSAIYPPLEHAEWNGWTPTDVVFPSFVWIVGLTLTLSFQKRMAAGATRADLLRQAFRRAAILFGLGLFLYGFPRFDLATWRILGVLQRIAICYLAGAAIWLMLMAPISAKTPATANGTGAPRP